MEIIESQINPASPEFKANATCHDDEHALEPCRDIMATLNTTKD